MRIEIISGSPRAVSVNYRLALHLKRALQKNTDHEVDVIDVRNNLLPQLDQVFVSVDATPDEYKDLANRMFAADAYILITPEYNGSYSACLKNLLDHFPKQHHKVFGIVTASPGDLGGVRAALQLQQLIYALFGIGSPYMLMVPQIDKKFDEAGNLLDDSFKKSVDLFIKEFLWLSERIVVSEVGAKNVQ